MSDLQIGLIALGVLLILVVLGLNWWQDRRVRRRMQQHFPGTEQDALLSEPAPAANARREPGFGAEAPVDAAGTAAVASSLDEEADPATEVVIDIAFPGPVAGSELIALTQGWRSVGRKPVRLFAETAQGRHEIRLRPDGVYTSLHLALLLANRSGPLTAIEWSQAWTRAQALAERLDATVEGPDSQLVVDQAVKLDDVCAALDTQVGLTLMLGRARPVGEVLAAARDQGFVAAGPYLAWPSADGPPRFLLQRADGASLEDVQGFADRLNLLLDVPRHAPDARAFGRMVEVGRQLAASLDASLVDDQGRPLADGADAAIDERLQVLYGQLEQAGLAAGSTRAQRVFS